MLPEGQVDNIDCITERVKLLLKDLFAAHVELAIEAKKWKKKFQKLTTKVNGTTKSPPLFDVSNRSCDSSYLSSPSDPKDVITFIRKDSTNANNKHDLSDVHLVKEAKCLKNSTTVSKHLVEIKKEKFDPTPSVYKQTVSTKSPQVTSQRLKSTAAKLQPNIAVNIFSDNLSSDSVRDFESPEPFIPSWKRRQLTRPSLIVPDTEPIDYDDFKTSTPNKSHKTAISIKHESPMKNQMLNHQKRNLKSPPPIKQTIKKEHLTSPEIIDVKSYFAKSELDNLVVAENLKEFISPSPDKNKPPANRKAAKKQAPSVNSRKTRSKTNSQESQDDLFSFLNRSPIEHASSNADRGFENKNTVAESSSGESKPKIDGSELYKTPSEKEVDQLAEELRTSDASSFDPDETYCPILREKELLDEQNKKFSPLNNASMLPGLRLSQYCTMDPDQTFDPNSANHDAALATSADLSQIRTPSPLDNFQDDLESQELIACNPTVENFSSESLNEIDDKMPRFSGKKFAANNARSYGGDLRLREVENIDDNLKRPALLDDSFDRVPQKKSTSPEYAHVDVVRKKSERYKLDAFACEQCKKWYDAAGMSEEERKERMKGCRHRAKYQPTSTPEHYWSIGFPDTEVCKKRGYIEVEDEENKGTVTRARRKRAYRKIF